MYVNQITVQVTVAGGSSVIFADEDGYNAGSIALQALEAQDQIDAILVGDEENSEAIIPYSAIDHAFVTVTRAQVEDPVDANCPSNGEGD